MIQELLEKYAWLIGVLALFGFEVAPIKFSPLTLLGNIVGKALGIDKILIRLDNLENTVNDNELDRIRCEILQFSGSLRNGLNRTETDYRHIEEIYKKYSNRGGNSYIGHEIEYIRSCHDQGRIM